MDFVTPIVLVTILLLIVAIGIIMLVLVYQKKQLQLINEKVQLRAGFEKEMLESKLEMQEQTMKSISQEIHDNVGQVLSLVKLNMSLMNCDEPKPLLQERIKSSSQLLGKAIQDLRDLSKVLHPDSVSEMDFIKAVEYELDLIKKTADYSTVLTIEGERYNITNQKKLVLFRILQEALNNIIKHAKAVTVNVLVGYFPNKFVLQITDDGKGFNISEVKALNGLGVKNMRNRSELIGADFSIKSEPGTGTAVKIDLPIT